MQIWIVIEETMSGDPEAAASRRRALEGIPILEVSPEAEDLAQRLVEEGSVPKKAAADALHIGIAAVNGIDYLVTWNCTHLANAARRGDIELVCWKSGYESPLICTPEELMEQGELDDA